MTRVSPTCSPLRSSSRNSIRVWAASIRDARPRPRAPARTRAAAHVGSCPQVRAPVSSRNTSSRLRRSTRSSSASTSWPAHQAVSVASSCGSTSPVDQVAARRLLDRAASRRAARRRSSSSAQAGPARNRICPSAPARVSSAGVPCGDHPAGVDDHDAVGELLGLVEEVGGEHDGDAVGAQLADELPGGAPGLRVHAGRRLVQEHQLGTADERQRQRQPLLLAAGQPLHRRAGDLGQPDRVQQHFAGPADARRRRRTAAAARRRWPRCSRRRRPAA